MPDKKVKLPYVDYTKNFTRIRVLHPEQCMRKSFRTLMVGMFGKFKVVKCEPVDSLLGKFRTQTILVPSDRWEKDDEFARENLVLAMSTFDTKVCIGGLSEEDKKRFPEISCR